MCASVSVSVSVFVCVSVCLCVFGPRVIHKWVIQEIALKSGVWTDLGEIDEAEGEASGPRLFGIPRHQAQHVRHRHDPWTDTAQAGGEAPLDTHILLCEGITRTLGCPPR